MAGPGWDRTTHTNHAMTVMCPPSQARRHRRFPMLYTGIDEDV